MRAQAVLSGISHGTELNLYRGTSPFDQKRFDPELRLFLEGADRPSYPMGLGYEWVGRVVEVGEEVTDFAVGDLVHLLHHGQIHVSCTPAELATSDDPVVRAFVDASGVKR